MKTKLIFIFVVVLVISGCEGNSVRRTLGLTKKAPDEFMVLSRPSLTVPPEFKLAPPDNAALYKTSKIPGKAKTILYGETETASKPKSSGEQTLLKKAKSGEANSNIRELLVHESRSSIGEGRKKDERGVIDILVNPELADKDPIIDADKERDRIHKNMREGRPLTEGEVPVVEREAKSVLKQIIE